MERKPRKRRESNLNQYVLLAREKIAQHMTEFLELQAQGKTKDAARIKNIISAYESRIGKQFTTVDLQNKAATREHQLFTVLSVC